MRSMDAIGKAHETSEALALCKRFDACCDYVKLDALAETHEGFSTFEAIDGSFTREST